MCRWRIVRVMKSCSQANSNPRCESCDLGFRDILALFPKHRQPMTRFDCLVRDFDKHG